MTVNVVEGKRIHKPSIKEQSRLGILLKQIGVMLDMPCGGNHTCGKCKIRVSGNLSPMTEGERKLLTKEEVEDNIRLACFTKVLGDISIYPNTDNTDTLSMVILPKHNLTEKGYGLAVDIGTTTVAMQLYDLYTGKMLGEALGANAQGPFGADVISRIQNATNNGNKPQQEAIQNQLVEMAKDCMAQGGIECINKSVITGNTTMLHLYEGLEAKGIAVAPFTPTSLFGRQSSYTLAGSPAYLPKCIGSYIGADITCTILATEMIHHSDKIELLADLGTNGEMALNIQGELYCASTAAGPAFEGANLTFGMRAGKGAITKVEIKDGEVIYETVGNVTPKGICGSGVLDAVSVMLDLEIIDETGHLDNEFEGPGKIIYHNEDLAWEIPGTKVSITQKDIRQIQLAKSAIFAGIKTLLKEENLSPADVDTFYVAGGFGHYMNRRSASNIGLFPKELEDRIKLVGNGALSGAIALLLDADQKTSENSIVSKSKEIELSGNTTFSDYYVEGMLFGDE
ncbi:ASKHA domain-containing protein [Maledivibacter halophilus]|uniref:Uncharacterized 2Fe-2 and 4Fe-4S clusters-containing protein, contains DUF4445 domain n=1 Tax=Maledivibacter halophilus TaxID=36842 RepID=A0A1T5LMA0_9FIRM|nr:ASKHA domain-containing protein [Maledivibacter halophilus]SKC77117.1 Uncharacterized 2Fe-2 and 4Fe-4S clusters-containing protein, contains DUF4445 domain [Maledivibacter halophilus]